MADIKSHIKSKRAAEAALAIRFAGIAPYAAVASSSTG